MEIIFLSAHAVGNRVYELGEANRGCEFAEDSTTPDIPQLRSGSVRLNNIVSQN